MTARAVIPPTHHPVHRLVGNAGQLDARSAHRVLDLLHALGGEHGLAVLLVTHDQDVAARADRALHVDPERRALLPVGTAAR